ncbi:MAG: NAD(P)-dependent oxidoreductase [Candidatus Obscuribacterales bacterium]|nr:NAD(P)-dependent oxidoreductase [Candidatus Obscuribacterales bacterium]
MLTTPVKPEQKIIRVLRLKVLDRPGYFGRIASRLGELKANIGEISIVSQGPDFIIRDISVQIQDDKHLAVVVAGIDEIEGVQFESVIDPVQTIHEGGKIAVRSRVKLESLADLRKIYTPGVAQICKLIHKDISLSRQYTAIPNTVAIVTNGTAILGLGNIGPVAGMPVMEGKAVLYEQLVGISAVPILIDSADIDEIVATVKAIAPTFGAIHLEDIAAPECFEVERRLQEELSIPVLHDDQHATAVVVLAALLTITQRMGIELTECSLGVIGLGAAGAGIGQLLQAFGVKKLFGADLRQDALDRWKSRGGTPTDLTGVMKNADVIVATTGVPGLIKPEMVREGQVILAISNPDPEIDPELAITCGARYAADGRTINNALSYPGLFRGAIMANARCFTNSMKIAAAHAIAGQTKMDNLVPSILDREVHQHVADAVALACADHEC